MKLARRGKWENKATTTAITTTTNTAKKATYSILHLLMKNYDLGNKRTSQLTAGSVKYVRRHKVCMTES